MTGRAADDFEAIRKRMAEIATEQKPIMAINPSRLLHLEMVEIRDRIKKAFEAEYKALILGVPGMTWPSLFDDCSDYDALFPVHLQPGQPTHIAPLITATESRHQNTDRSSYAVDVPQETLKRWWRRAIRGESVERADQNTDPSPKA